MDAEIEFIYTRDEVREGLDGAQYLLFKIEVRTEYYLARLLNCRFDVTLYGDAELGKLIAFCSGTPTGWFGKGKKGTYTIECWIQVTPVLVDKLHEMLINDCKSQWEIVVEYLIEYYERHEDITPLRLPENRDGWTYVYSYQPDGKTKQDRILFSTDHLKELLEKLKHFELIRINIPVCKERAPALESAIKQIENAVRNFKDGKFVEALKDVRNALQNHVMTLEKKNGDREWVLKEEIRDEFIRKSPSEMNEIYKEVLKRVENTLRNQIRIISDCFMHKDSDKLKVSPMREDVQSIIITVANILNYLSQRILA